jgi:hypothetical protein
MVRCIRIKPRCFLNPKYQVIDGSRVRISDFPLPGGAKYEPSENLILLYVSPSAFDGENVTIRDKSKRKFSIPIDELFSEVIEHEFLHMLLFHFISSEASGLLNNIDRELRANFYDKYLVT